MMADTVVRQGTWVSICRVDQLKVDVGVAALVGGEQVALFRLDVEEVFVASPMYKQPFDLRTGHCLDDPAVSVPTFDVRVVDGAVQVLAPPDKDTPDG
jgi:nitrite reductase (NADH) small subunit